MVNAGEDVLNTENGVSASDLQRGRGSFHHKRGTDGVRRQLGRCRRAVRGARGRRSRWRETGDANGAALQAACAHEGPTLGEGAVHHCAPRRGDMGAAGRELHVESEAQMVSDTRHFPERVVGFRAGLTEFEIGGTHFVGQRRGREQGEQNQNGSSFLIFLRAFPFCLDRLRRSIVTV